MNHHLTSAWSAGPLERLLRIGMLALTVTFAACGGGDDAAAPAAVEFEVIAGDGACGAGGCGGDSGDGSGVGGAADGGGDGAGGGLGAMQFVRVTARKPNGTILGSALLDNTKNLVSLYARTYKDEFILEFADDGSGKGAYFDEATETWTLLNGQALHILVPKLTHHVSANILTEAAYQWALNKYGTEAALTAVRMAEANEAVRQAFNSRVSTAYQLTDITNYAVAVSDTTVANSLPNTHAGRFGTLLAAVPRAARLFRPGLPSPALAFMRQLVKDIRDDGTVNDSADDAEAQAYDNTLSLLLADAIVSARAQYGVSAQPAPVAVATVCFNPANFTVGAKQTLDYGDYSLSLEVTRNTSFEGQASALEIEVIDSGTTSLSYFAPNLGDGLTFYGSSEVKTEGSLTLRQVQVVSPTVANRQFLLRAGETDVVVLNSSTILYNPDGSVFQPAVPNPVVTVRTTFLGFETAFVPAGTFKNACKYEVTEETDDGDGGTISSTRTDWYTASGQGVQVRSVAGTIASELQSGTVNGAPVK